MDYGILFWEDTALSVIVAYWGLLIFMAIRGLVKDMGWNTKSKLVLVVLAVLLIIIPYYGIDHINYNTLNGLGDATAYAYKQAIETDPHNAYGRNYYENLTDEERTEINNLISNMDENRGKIGYHYGYDAMAYANGYSSPARLYGESLIKMKLTPVIIPGLMIILLWTAAGTINHMIDNLKKDNYKLKAENKKFEIRNTDLQKNVKQNETKLTNIKNEMESYLQESATKRALYLKANIERLTQEQRKLYIQKEELDNNIKVKEKRLQAVSEELKKEEEKLKKKKEEREQMQTQENKEKEVSDKLTEEFFKEFKA